MAQTQFVGVRNVARWIVDTGVEKVIDGIRQYVEADFLRWERFDKVPRVASHTPFGVIELMPTSDSESYGFKYVNGHPSNPARGFQTVTAFGALADVHNGYPVFMAEMTLVTALRTAAVSALTVGVLAPAGATTMAMIGAGSQAEFQALAIRSATGIRQLRVWDTDPNATAKLIRNLEPLGFDIVAAGGASDAVRGAEVITTCTADKARATVLPASAVGPGVHINAIGGDCPGKTELDGSLLERSSVFVEYEPQTRIEGEIQQMPADFPVTEFHRVLSGRASGRVSADEITVFDSVGFAIEDFAALRFLRDNTVGTDYAEQLDLIAEPEDPKDLFGLVNEPVPVA